MGIQILDIKSLTGIPRQKHDLLETDHEVFSNLELKRRYVILIFLSWVLVPVIQHWINVLHKPVSHCPSHHWFLESAHLFSQTYHATHFTPQQGSCQEAIYIILIATSFKYFSLLIIASKCKHPNTSTNAKRRAFSVIFICWWAWFSLRPNASHFSFRGKPASKTNLSLYHQNNSTKKVWQHYFNQVVSSREIQK